MSSISANFIFQEESLPSLRYFDFPLEQVSFDEASGLDYNNVSFFKRGSRSTIFKARKNSENVVIKMLKRKNHEEKSAVEELNRELNILASTNHENIVKLKGSGIHPRKFISVEYLEGGSLTDLVQQQSAESEHSSAKYVGLPLLSVLSISSDLATALKYLHEDFDRDAVIIHRDLKPQNIAFTADRKLKLIDFGLAACVRRRAQSSDKYLMTGGVGTLAYMAPEVALRRPYNEKVDIYSFGMILWQLLTGEPPFNGLSREEYMMRVVRGGVRPPVPTSAPADLVHLIRTCWDANPDRRPSASSIIKQLFLLKTFSDGDRGSSGGRLVRSISLLSGKRGRQVAVDTSTAELDQLSPGKITGKKNVLKKLPLKYVPRSLRGPSQPGGPGGSPGTLTVRRF